MLDFVCIFSIFLEVILTFLALKGLIRLEKKVEKANKKLLEAGEIIILANKKIKNIISKTNKVVSFITNKKVAQAKRIISILIDVIQMIILIRSLNFSKGFKTVNFKNIKKLLLLQTTRTVIKNIFINVKNFL